MRDHFARLEQWLGHLEGRYGRWLVAALVGLGCMALAAVYVRPATVPISLGLDYAELARDPFSTTNPNGYRILTPLVAYLLGLRGNAIQVLNLIVAWLLLVFIYREMRRLGHGTTLALGTTLLVGLSMPTLFTIHVAGYTDSTTYLFVVLMLGARSRPWLYWSLFFVGLLNRESIAFLVPFFVVLSFDSMAAVRRSWWQALLGVGASLLLYLALRYAMSLRLEARHSLAYYLGPLTKDPLYWLRKTAPSYYAGFFSAFKLFWVVPAAAVYLAIMHRDWRDVLLLVAPVAGALAQTAIAVDTSRMVALSFPCLIIGVQVLLKYVVEPDLVAGLAGLLLVNWFVPQLYVTWDKIWVMHSTIAGVAEWLWRGLRG